MYGQPENVAAPKYQVGDTVFALNFGRGARWVPGQIVHVISSYSYSVQVHDILWKRHGDQLRPRAASVSECSPLQTMSGDAIDAGATDSQRTVQPPATAVLTQLSSLPPPPPPVQQSEVPLTLSPPLSETLQSSSPQTPALASSALRCSSRQSKPRQRLIEQV